MGFRAALMAAAAMGVLIGFSGLLEWRPSEKSASAQVSDDKIGATPRAVSLEVSPSGDHAKPQPLRHEAWLSFLVNGLVGDGGISLNEMQVIAEIADLTGSSFETQQLYTRTVRRYAHENGGVSLLEALALAQVAANADASSAMNRGDGSRQVPAMSDSAEPTNPVPAYSFPTSPEQRPLNGYSRIASTNSTESRYRGMNGTQYQYDLANPADALRYSVDPAAQLNDSISVDPRVEMDRAMGQRGGGISHD